jgi:hypothetical protein
MFGFRTRKDVRIATLKKLYDSVYDRALDAESRATALAALIGNRDTSLANRTRELGEKNDVIRKLGVEIVDLGVIRARQANLIREQREAGDAIQNILRRGVTRKFLRSIPRDMPRQAARHAWYWSNADVEAIAVFLGITR